MSVQISFTGICTFVSQTTVPELPGPWRAVVVNSFSTGGSVRGIPVNEHRALMVIERPGEPTQELLLSGTRMFLTSRGAPPPFNPLPTFGLLPNLTLLMKDLEPLGPPSGAVVLESDPALASAYFDVTMGTLSAALTQEFAATTMLNVDTTDTLTLVMEPFGTDPPSSIPLPPGTTIIIANEDTGPRSEAIAVDFLIHYLTAATLPLVPQVPQEIHLPFIDVTCTAGAGCSNSTYP
ncbi:MAG TPA: hypothetical protein VEK57_03555 [Thermoanaerobaculia bacterium]|nr:hypothetical protein [Thermoanaerobaculia bacterium]